jgi:hypothetical protein
MSEEGRDSAHAEGAAQLSGVGEARGGGPQLCDSCGMKMPGCCRGKGNLCCSCVRDLNALLYDN